MDENEERRYMALKLAVELRKGKPMSNPGDNTVITAKKFEDYLKGGGR
jgi:hypothetical protein